MEPSVRRHIPSLFGINPTQRIASEFTHELDVGQLALKRNFLSKENFELNSTWHSYTFCDLQALFL